MSHVKQAKQDKTLCGKKDRDVSKQEKPAAAKKKKLSLKTCRAE